MTLDAIDFDDAELQELAQALFNEYARQASSRKRPYPKKMDQKIWLRMAKLVQKLKATPDNFILAQFECSKGHLFANALAGQVAEGRYKRWWQQKAATYEETFVEGQEEQEPDEGKDIDLYDLQGRIMSTYASMNYYCGSTDFFDPAVITKVMNIQLHWDPVVMMLLNPTPMFKKVFGKRAKQQIEESKGLREAICKLGFDMVLDYLDEEDGEEVQS